VDVLGSGSFKRDYYLARCKISLQDIALTRSPPLRHVGVFGLEPHTLYPGPRDAKRLRFYFFTFLRFKRFLLLNVFGIKRQYKYNSS